MFKPKLVMNTTLTTVLYTSKTLSDGTHVHHLYCKA